MPKSKTCLPDVNVWLALASRRHIHNPAAVQWLDGIDNDQAVFCRITQMGFLRLLTNSAAMGVDVRSQAEAWSAYETTLGDPRVRFLAEPVGVEEAWRTLTQGKAPSSQDWTDAYLLAFAQMRDLQLISFDQGLRRYGDPRVLVLPRP